jgi:hypothetical protein
LFAVLDYLLLEMAANNGTLMQVELKWRHLSLLCCHPL